jgi:hypothetical protein
MFLKQNDEEASACHPPVAGILPLRPYIRRLKVTLDVCSADRTLRADLEELPRMGINSGISNLIKRQLASSITTPGSETI